MNQYFRCPDCGREHEVDTFGMSRGADIELVCDECEREWSENPEESYYDGMY